MRNHEYYNFIFTYPNNQHVKHSLIFFLSKEKGSKEVSENTSARGPQGKERLQIASYTLSSLLTDNSNHSSTKCIDALKKH